MYSDPVWITLAARGPVALYAGWLLKKKALRAGVFPSPMSEAFIMDLSINIARLCRRRTPNFTRYQRARRISETFFVRAMKRVKGTPVAYYDSFDDFMTRHNVAPPSPLLPSDIPDKPTEQQKIIRSKINEI